MDPIATITKRSRRGDKSCVVSVHVYHLPRTREFAVTVFNFSLRKEVTLDTFSYTPEDRADVARGALVYAHKAAERILNECKL